MDASKILAGMTADQIAELARLAADAVKAERAKQEQKLAEAFAGIEKKIADAAKKHGVTNVRLSVNIDQSGNIESFRYTPSDGVKQTRNSKRGIKIQKSDGSIIEYAGFADLARSLGVTKGHASFNPALNGHVAKAMTVQGLSLVTEDEQAEDEKEAA
jgi:hypothetical protein